MNCHPHSAKQQGFTLLELVIVLGVTGIIFGGLWGLLSNSGGQVRAQASAQVYRQVIDATKKYLLTDVARITDYPCASTTSYTAIDPNKINAALSISVPQSDSYGPIAIKAKCNTTTNAWDLVVYSNISAPTTTNGPDDKTGAQIAALIGAEGGFVYRNATDGCTGAAVTQLACGTYGSFSKDVFTLYGIAAGSGRVVAVATSSDNQLDSSPWLARIDMSTTFNTVSAASTYFDSAGNSTLYMQGNTINMFGGTATKAGDIRNISALTGPVAAVTLNTSPTTNTFRLRPMVSGTAAANGAVLETPTSGDIQLNAGNVTAPVPLNTGIITLTGSGGVKLTSTSTTTGEIKLLSSTTITLSPTNTNSVNVVRNGSGTSADTLFSVSGRAVAEILEAGSFYYQSDETLKTNIRPIPNALERISTLHGVNFDWKDAKGHPRKDDMGVIAQEVEKVFPEAVSTLSNGKLGVDYPRLVGPLVEAVRQLKEENDTLKARLDKLEAKQADKK